MTAKTTTSPINKDKNFFARTISTIKKFSKKDFQLSPKAVEIDTLTEMYRKLSPEAQKIADILIAKPDIRLNMPKEQVEFIHEQAEKIATEIDKSIEIINKKAETVFKYLVTIATALLWLYVYGAKTKIAINDKYILGIIFIILIFIGIYIWAFIYPKKAGSIYNAPATIMELVSQKNELFDMKRYLINDILSLQNNICASRKNLVTRCKYLQVLATAIAILCFAIVGVLFFLRI
jgi:hypothetical protein